MYVERAHKLLICNKSYEALYFHVKLNSITISFVIQDVPACASNPCKNGGTCNNKNGGGYYCNCTLRYGGADCQYGKNFFDRNTLGTTQI